MMNLLKKRILSFILCLLMVFGTLAELPLAVSATEISENSVPHSYAEQDSNSVSANDSEDIHTADTSQTAEQETADEDTTVTVSFYDSDKTTLLFSYDLPYYGDSVHLYSVVDTSEACYPVYKGYYLDYWTCAADGKQYTPYETYAEYDYDCDTNFYATWSDEKCTFYINYNLNGGSFPDSPEDNAFTVESDTITLPLPQRKTHLFDGWYTDSAFTNKVTTIPKGTYVNSDKNGEVDDYQLYAKWTAISLVAASKPKAQNKAKGKIKVTYAAVDGAEGYEVTFATNKKFTKNKLTKNVKNKKSMSLTNLKKGTTYYFKVRAYRTDSTGSKCYGKYSAVASCKVKNGVKEYAAKSNSGKLKKVSIKNNTDLYVKATVSKRLKSSDGFYYLVKVDPNTGKVLKQIAKTDKSKSVVFQLPLRDTKGNNHIHGKFGVAVKKGKKYMLITSTSFINNPEAAATYTEPFPTPASKKGRQGLYDKSLGDKNFFANFNLNTIIGTKSNHQVKYKYNGKTYYFNYPNFYSLSGINEDGGTVTVQVMLQYDAKCKDLILKSGRTPGAHYYAFNTETKAAREKLEAAFNFLAEQGSKQNCHVDNWILGNEVNTYANMNAKWYYAGNISRDKFIENYASTYRMLYYAVKSNNKNGRVYICCDHTWINRENDWGTRYFTKAFNDEIKSQNKNIKWNLAYHAYSAVLTNADFWNDGSLAPNNINADFVSPKNLEILTNYIKENFGKDTRIILSEQGFSYSGGVGSPYNVGRQTGQDVQAAACAWLYYKAQFNDMIDAVIFSSGDHGGAGYQFDFYGKKAENVYKYMDTPKYATYTKNCLKTIGKSSWKDAVKGFNAKKLKKMPNR